MSPSKVLIPVDGSPASLRALDFAIEMARQHPGASLLPLKYRSLAPRRLLAQQWGAIGRTRLRGHRLGLSNRRFKNAKT